MAWAGTGVIWTVSGGVLSSRAFGKPAGAKGELNFVQISDSHLGFNKPANPDVAGTLHATLDKINAQSSGHVRISRFVEAQMAVADLDEVQLAFRACRF